MAWPDLKEVDYLEDALEEQIESQEKRERGEPCKGMHDQIEAGEDIDETE